MSFDVVESSERVGEYFLGLSLEPFLALLT